MQPLPIDPHLPRIRDAVAQGPVVLEAETGAGKTTRVPPCLEVEGQIWLVEPRRVAARAAAQRMAQERGWTVGDEVGWHVRFDRRFADNTRILCLTEGMFLQRLRTDPFLDGVSAVILDEVHERSVDMDLCLALLRELRSVRDDLGLIAMSATLDAERLADWLGAQRIRSEGRTFPVTVEHARRPDPRPIEVQAADAVRDALDRLDGDILVFLPGVAEIRRCQEQLQDASAAVAILHGNLPLSEQSAVLAPSPHRRVVLATNVAESSVTVPGVKVIVDSGLVRQPRFDGRTGLSPLATVPISQASAEQRTGRAGRVAAGVCLRLWTAADHRDRSPFTLPELQRANLAGPVLQLRSQGIDPHRFGWFEAPPTRALDAADRLLDELGATDRGRVLPLGHQLVKWPVEPRIARLLYEARSLGHPRLGASAAALLSVRSPLERVPNGASLTEQLAALERGEGEPGRRHRYKQVRDQLLRLCRDRSNSGGRSGPAPEEALGRAVLAAWPERVCRRRAPEAARAHMATGQGVEWKRHRDAPTFVAIDLGPDAADRPVRLGCPIDAQWLPTEAVVEHSWADAAVRAERQTRYRALVLARHPVPVDPAAAASLLLQHAEHHLDQAQPTHSKWTGLLARLDCLHRIRPDDWPAVDATFLSTLLPHLCEGRRNLAQLRGADWTSALWTELGWGRKGALDRLAPATLLVPSGRHHPIRYATGEPPVLAIRMQELFGLADTPRIADGALPLRLELLAPNGRPQQITSDLGGFWAGSWAEVRKAMRGRYPKHDWPEDPLSAAPSRGARRRKS